MTASTKLDPVATKVAANLAEAGIAFYPTERGRVRVPLPGGFGEFEIGALDKEGDDSFCWLVGDHWHTHGYFGPGNDRRSLDRQCARLFNLVCEVFDGRCLLIEEQAPGEATRRHVTPDFRGFLKHLPEGASYKVFNATQEELDRRRGPRI